MDNNKIEAILGQNEYDPKAEYGANKDIIHVRQGDEHVRLMMKHPSEYPLVESHPKYNEEWIPGTGTFEGREQYQHTLWDRPHGSAHEPEVTDLFATPNAKNLVGTAIGLAVEHSHKRFAQTPIPSADLSQHALPLVEKFNKVLKEKGIKTHPTPWRPTNEVEQGEENAEKVRSHAEMAFKAPFYKPIADKEIGSANNLIRGLYKGRHNLNKQQFEQPELPF